MANTYLKGVLGFKGSRGYSAYETAVQHGFQGTEAQWLATLGTSSTFTQGIARYTTSSTGETTFALPNSYIDSDHSFVDVYVNGIRRNSSEYTIVGRNVVLTNGLEVVGTVVELTSLSMATNNLPMITYTGQLLEVDPGREDVEVNLPTGVTVNSKVMSVMSSEDNVNWVYNTEETSRADGMAYVSKVTLDGENQKLRITIINSSSTSQQKDCYYKIVFLNLN